MTKHKIKQHINDVDSLLGQVIAEAKALHIPISKKIEPHVYINTRARSRFGCCKKEMKMLEAVFLIEISSLLLTSPGTIIKQTLAHEVLHTCSGCHNHGALWNQYADLMNKVYGYNIKRTATYEELGLGKPKASLPKSYEAKYLIICNSCGTKFERTRMSPLVKYPQRYHCKCGGTLQRKK